ncbi:hypothetical protein DOTSEDRAFT_21418 [Dothistroma septosporum NZE10]|uniref:Zn(2)-C6 fungal-type domain-containing protein n=1 Tax=Dothistroma septosporum (strain NZE10 / CBS 128990) TaxID=675120 RepID=N1PZN0_DOTSN|nr:hypothetical protein DOTSEDRAFT_21418 [Dothistroma septosporum NZE10]
MSAAAHTPQSPQQTTAKRLRKGTKSCIECRHRKIKCTWQSHTDKVCVNCTARGRDCVPQIYQRRAVKVDKLSSRDRIHRLEQQIANLTAVAQGHVHPDLSSPSPPEEHASGSESPDDDDDDDYDHVHVPASTPPTHLKFLFDNALIGPSRHNDEFAHDLNRARCSPRYLNHAKAKLSRLVPNKDDVLVVSNYAEPWMRLYKALFPSDSNIGTKDHFMSRYDTALTEGYHPVHLARFLLVFAITARQVPLHEQSLKLPGWKDVTAYVHDVSQTVESTIVSNDELASTVEGLDTIVMYLRLQLGVGNIRSLWLSLRRTIAIAELIGLPRAWYRSRNDGPDHALSPQTDYSEAENRRKQKVALWEAICSTDRLASMMFNLPAATSTHRFPRRQITTPAGEILVQPYMFQLAGIGMGVQELDEGYTLGRNDDEMFEKVLTIERQLRSLKAETPKQWWRETDENLSADLLIQFWHYYLTARMHLHAAMSEDDHDQYAYSRTACREAAESMARRYPTVRRLLPTGFFIYRIVDMQVFTAASFLCLSYMKQSRQGAPVLDESNGLVFVEQIVATMDSVAGQPGSEFVEEASSAIRSLLALIRDPHGLSSDSRSLTLRIPLLGKIRIGRKQAPQAPQVPRANHVDYAPGGSLPSTSMPHAGMRVPASDSGMSHPMHEPFNTDMTNTLPWLMELDMNPSSLQDPFFYQNATQFDQWLGLNENMSY